MKLYSWKWKNYLKMNFQTKKLQAICTLLSLHWTHFLNSFSIFNSLNLCLFEKTYCNETYIGITALFIVWIKTRKLQGSPVFKLKFRFNRIRTYNQHIDILFFIWIMTSRFCHRFWLDLKRDKSRYNWYIYITVFVFKIWMLTNYSILSTSGAFNG